MITDDDRALVATITFIRALRQEWLTQQLGRVRRGDDPGPVPNWQDIPPAERRKFLKCMKSALGATKDENMLKVLVNAKAL
jgi:hypothetical protein